MCCSSDWFFGLDYRLRVSLCSGKVPSDNPGAEQREPMTTTEWHITNPQKHGVRLEHDFWSGKAALFVDATQIFARGVTLWDTGFEHRFAVEGLPCILRVISRPFHFTYELWVDGKLH